MGLNSKQTLEQLVARKLMVAVEEILLVSVIKKSIDARKKNNICLVYAVVVQLKDNKKIIKLIGKDKDISLVELEQKEKIEYGANVYVADKGHAWHTRFGKCCTNQPGYECRPGISQHLSFGKG